MTRVISLRDVPNLRMKIKDRQGKTIYFDGEFDSLTYFNYHTGKARNFHIDFSTSIIPVEMLNLTLQSGGKHLIAELEFDYYGKTVIENTQPVIKGVGRVPKMQVTKLEFDSMSGDIAFFRVGLTGKFPLFKRTSLGSFEVKLEEEVDETITN